MDSVGKRLLSKRLELGLTLEQVKDSSNVKISSLSAIENDKTLPSAQAIIALSKLYGVSSDWILTGEEFISQLHNNEISYDFSECEIRLIKKIRKLSPENRLKIEGMVEIKLSENETGHNYMTEKDEHSASLLQEPIAKYKRHSRPKIEKRGSSSLVSNNKKISRSRLNA